MIDQRSIRQKFEDEEDWQVKVILIDMYHCQMLLKFGSRWRLRDTATYFQKSMGLISEDLAIAELIRNDEMPGNIDSRKRAITHLNSIKEKKNGTS